MKRNVRRIANMKYIYFAMLLLCMNMLSSCISTTSYELRKSCEFKPQDANKAPLHFYRLDNQYYLECDVTYETINRNVTLGGCMGAKSIKAPINMHRKVTEKYYFLLPPNATSHLFGCKTEGVVSEDEHCLSVSEWDAEKAVPVTPARKPPDICIFEVYEDEYQNLYDSRKNELTLRVPKYRPWDYWVKQPLSVVLFVAVDIPATLISPIFIVPYYEFCAP